MIQYIRIQNFRAVKDIALELGPLNIVFGPNGCGKSNIYNAIHLLTAAAATNSWWGVLAIVTLIISAILTAIYLFTVVANAWFRPLNNDMAALAGKSCDPSWQMKLPLAVLSVVVILFGIFSTPFVQWLRDVAAGLML